MLVAMFFISLYVGIWISSNLFIHTHEIDGILITHSHPYQSGNHGHSASEVSFISAIALNAALWQEQNLFLNPFLGIASIINPSVEYFPITISGNHPALRAPPIFS